MQAAGQKLEFRVLDVSRPVDQRGGLQLPEAQRHLDIVDPDRHQTAILLAGLGLVDHPLAVDRGVRPQHDHAVRLLELVLDGAAEALPGQQLAVPEDTPSALLERLLELPRPRQIHVASS